VKDSGLSYAILRPTVLFGAEDILINNIAWLLRRFPVFALPGDGTYRLQPVFVDDLAALAVEAVFERGDSIRDAVGPDIFTFREMVELIGSKVGVARRLLQTPPRLALSAAQLLGVLLRDVVLTPEEVQGLMANLLVSRNPPLCKTRLGDWLEENRAIVGMKYASELKRHFD
jgi:NADH dehydrogenase